MKRIKTSNPTALSTAINVISDGGIIVYPTDTLYGIGVDATNDTAIDKINNLKGRSGAMSVLAPDISTAIEWMNLSVKQNDIVPFYLGGAKTLIAPVKSNIVSSKILGENNTLGIRIPDNDFCNMLSTEFGKPITTTSVNRTNDEPLNNPDLIESAFGNEIDLLIDGGTLPLSQGSTIYQLKNNNITILRK